MWETLVVGLCYIASAGTRRSRNSEQSRDILNPRPTHLEGDAHGQDIHHFCNCSAARAGRRLLRATVRHHTRNDRNGTARRRRTARGARTLRCDVRSGLRLAGLCRLSPDQSRRISGEGHTAGDGLGQRGLRDRQHAMVGLPDDDCFARLPGGGEFANVASNWLRWTFKGDKKAAAMFVGKNCSLCTNSNWDVKLKGLAER
jgi:hypothetical protein